MAGVKLPTLTRKKGPKGKYTGNYLVKVNGRQVNLGTKVLDGPDGAIERSKQAKAGRTNFRDDVDTAAEQLGQVPASSPAIAPPSAPAPPMPAPTSVTPDAVIPPRPLLVAVPLEAADESAANQAAAAETVGGGSDAGGAAGEPVDVDPDVLDQMLTQGAEMLVDAQLGIQAAIIKKRTGKIAATVPHDSKLRTLAAAAWVAQLKIWLPHDLPLPPIALALLLPFLAMPAQVKGATDPPEEKPADIPAAA